MEDEILRAVLAPGADCLSVEQLGRYADGALTGEERSAAAAHIRVCVTCQTELALLEALTGDAVPVERRPARFATYRIAAIAAVIVIGIVSGSLYVLRTRQAPALPSGVRTGDEVTRSAAITVRAPVGDQLEAPRRLDWVPVDRAVQYRVRFMEADRREIGSISTSTAGAEVPPDVRASIAPRKTLLWDVTAYDAAGRALAESGMQSFRVVPR